VSLPTHYFYTFNPDIEDSRQDFIDCMKNIAELWQKCGGMSDIAHTRRDEVAARAQDLPA
jgi:hypothetical protein